MLSSLNIRNKFMVEEMRRQSKETCAQYVARYTNESTGHNRLDAQMLRSMLNCQQFIYKKRFVVFNTIQGSHNDGEQSATVSHPLKYLRTNKAGRICYPNRASVSCYNLCGVLGLMGPVIFNRNNLHKN